MPNQIHHSIGFEEFCIGCGRTRRCRAIVETPGKISCWCEPCWMGFLGLAYEARETQEKARKEASGNA